MISNYKLQITNSGKGFTIIELLVVVAVVAVFLIITISNFSQIRVQFALSRVVNQFAQDLRRAQDMALSQTQYKDSSGALQSPSGYGVYADIVNLGSKKYIIYADSSSGNQQYDASDFLVATIDFGLTEPGIIIKEINNISGNKVSVNFNSSNINTAITQLNLNQNNVDIIFALESDLIKTRTVLVNTSGLIEIK